MGAKQSKRSVDITNTPTKGEVEAIGEGEGRVVKIGDADIKTTTNGAVPHTDLEIGEKDENAKDLTVEKEDNEKEVAEVKENGVSESEEAKTPDSESVGDNLNETEKSPESTENKVDETAEAKKQKEKKKKKWSFRSISFSKKDKSKPGKDSEKNGDVKEVAEENIEETATSPSTESPKTEKPESPEETPVLNGEASKEEIVKDEPKSETPIEESKNEEPTQAEPDKVKPETEPVPEPKVEETKAEEPKAVEAEPPKVPEPVVESDPSPKEQEESAPTNPPVEEIKEVRNEELPPPLPSSNPPSSVTVFAESTKADILTTAHIDLLEAVSAEPSVEVVKCEVDSTHISAVDLNLPAQELSEQVADIAVPKESELKLEISSEVSETEVAKDSELKLDIIPEKLIVNTPVTAAEIEKPVVELQNSETEVTELQTIVSDSSVSEIKVASESLASIPDPELCEPKAANQLEVDVTSESVLFETKVVSLESKTSLEPQPAETNLLKDTSEVSIRDSPELGCLGETCLSSEKSIVELPEQTAPQIPEPIVSLNVAVLEPQISVEPKVELEINSEASIPEKSQQKSEPQSKSEIQSKSELLTTSSDISENFLNQSNKTDLTKTVNNPPQSVDLSPPANVSKDSEIVLPGSEKPSTESKDCLQSSVTPENILQSAKYEDKSEQCNSELQPLVTPEDTLQLAKSEDNIEQELQPSVTSEDSFQSTRSEEKSEICGGELQPSVTSEDSLLSAKSEDKNENSSTELQPINTEVNPLEVSLIHSEESSNTLPASDCVPTEEPKSPSKVDDSEGKSVSEDFPIDLPSPTDLPPPASIIMDRIVDPADSLPDISTESLPSLPEPVSENLAEPMSLPPVDSVPEPIATDCQIPSESVPLSHPVLTNGNTNGLPSPSDEDAQTLKEGQLKQVPPTETPSELIKDDAEKVAPVEVASVEE